VAQKNVSAANGAVFACQQSFRNVIVGSLDRPQVTQYRGGRPLGILPIASRIDTRSQVNEVLEFKKRFTQAFGELVARHTRRKSQFLELSLIPYVGLYSYVERSVARLPEENRDLDLIKPYYAIAEALVEYGIEHVGLKKVEVAADSAARSAWALRSTIA